MMTVETDVYVDQINELTNRLTSLIMVILHHYCDIQIGPL